MRDILHLVSDLDAHGLTRQALHVAAAQTENRIRLFSLAVPGLFSAVLPPLNHLDQRAVRLGVGERLWQLRRAIFREKPDLCHVWGFTALQQFGLATLGRWRRLPPLIVTLPLERVRLKSLGRMTRSLLARAKIVLAPSLQAQAWYQQQGLSTEVIAPGVPIREPLPRPAELTEGVHWIVGVGQMNTKGRMIEMHWAFDILHYVVDHWQAMVIGDGQERQSLQERINSIMCQPGRIQLLGWRTDPSPYVSHADIIWVPRQKAGGSYALLEGMAAGKVCVTNDLPHLREIAGSAGGVFFVASGDMPGYARVSRPLMADAATRSQHGQANQEWIRTHHSLNAMQWAYLERYDN